MDFSTSDDSIDISDTEFQLPYKFYLEKMNPTNPAGKHSIAAKPSKILLVCYGNHSKAFTTSHKKIPTRALDMYMYAWVLI